MWHLPKITEITQRLREPVWVLENMAQIERICLISFSSLDFVPISLTRLLYLRYQEKKKALKANYFNWAVRWVAVLEAVRARFGDFKRKHWTKKNLTGHLESAEFFLTLGTNYWEITSDW